jgi:hypothetical protein
MEVMNAENAGALFCPALLYYRPSMALCNICIDLQGWRECRKIVWSKNLSLQLFVVKAFQP